jgi:hypothetical protein
MVLRDRLGRYPVGLNCEQKSDGLRDLGLAHLKGLSDELDIVRAGIVVLVDEVVADLRTTVEGARAAHLAETV